MNVDICNESGYDLDTTALLDLVRHVLAEMRIHPQAELSVLLVDAAAMERLHVQWMDEPGPTDVLAFPMDELRPGRRDDPAEDPGLLGDVVLCPEVAAAQAATAGHSTEEELHLLCTHGMLHLLGYDHAEPEEHTAMFGLQGQLLKAWQETKGRPGL